MIDPLFTHNISTVKDVTKGKVDIDLSIMSMIKIKKQLDLCDVLGSDVMGHKECPLSAGDLELDATGMTKTVSRQPFKMLTLSFISLDTKGITQTSS